MLGANASTFVSSLKKNERIKKWHFWPFWGVLVPWKKLKQKFFVGVNDSDFILAANAFTVVSSLNEKIKESNVAGKKVWFLLFWGLEWQLLMPIWHLGMLKSPKIRQIVYFQALIYVNFDSAQIKSGKKP